MAPRSIPLIAFGVLLVSITYQGYIKPHLFTSFGIGREVQPLENFPYNCRRVKHKLLEGCEDMWIDQDTRLLYAACANSYSRSQWCPTYAFLLGLNENLCLHLYILQYATTQFLKTGRRSYFGAQDRRTRRRRTFWPAYIETCGCKGHTSSAEFLDLHGFDVKALDDSRLRFWMINHRPPVDEKNIVLDANKLGANSTIEVFEVTRGSREMIHISTIPIMKIW